MPWRRMEEWKFSSIVLDICTGWTRMVSFTPLPLYLRRNNLPYPLDTKVGRPQRRCRVELILLPLAGLEPLAVQPVASGYTHWVILVYFLFSKFQCIHIWSWWPRRLRHEPSSLSRTLGSWVRIPLKAWMSVCVYSVLVSGSGLATGWSPVQGVPPTVLD
jgi:hypothetical protein